MRGERIGLSSEQCFILTETNIQHIFTQAEQVQPQLLVIDSIQTLYSSQIESSPGSISQVREGDLPGVTAFTDTQVCIPNGWWLSLFDQEHIIKTLNDYTGK